MEDVGKKCCFDEDSTAGCDTEDQQPSIKGPPFQSQSPGFHEINAIRKTPAKYAAEALPT